MIISSPWKFASTLYRSIIVEHGTIYLGIIGKRPNGSLRAMKLELLIVKGEIEIYNCQHQIHMAKQSDNTVTLEYCGTKSLITDCVCLRHGRISDAQNAGDSRSSRRVNPPGNLTLARAAAIIVC